MGGSGLFYGVVPAFALGRCRHVLIHGRYRHMPVAGAGI
jgi:hypothetical protein